MSTALKLALGGSRTAPTLMLIVLASVALRALCASNLAVALAASGPGEGGQPAPERPFGTLREQAAMQQEWLKKRLDTFLPALMRKHGIDMWVVPMREYNEDPVFSSITAPEAFAALRRTIYLFFDKCAPANPPVAPCGVEGIALGGT